MSLKMILRKVTLKSHDFSVYQVGNRWYTKSKSMRTFGYTLSKLLTRQCEVHAGQKVRQALQMYIFYSRIWGEEMARKMLYVLRRSCAIRSRQLLFSAVCLVPYNWEKNIIPEETLKSATTELREVEPLCRATVYCETCTKRQVIDKNIANISYCTCSGKIGYTDKSRQYDAWQPFIERENILVWRKKHHLHSHLHLYKVFGTRSDISVSAFMEVQLNAEFRTQWDSSAVELRVVDSHPDSNSDLIYWIVKFPQFFANRDYVFKRRFLVDDERKEVVIISQVDNETDVIEENSNLYRVKEYWSIMVLKASQDFNKPGMEYTLTYFDNPGTSLPSYVMNFVAATGFPNFLARVDKAALSLQRKWETGQDVYVTIPREMRYPKKLKLEVEGVREFGEWKDVVEGVGEFGERKDVVLMDKLEKSFQSVPDIDAVRGLKDEYLVVKTGKLNGNGDETLMGKEFDVKIPMKYKNSVIDVLEAIEVVAPTMGHSEKQKFVEKIGQLFEGDDQQQLGLVKGLRRFKERMIEFTREKRRTKEINLEIMREMESAKRKHGRNSYDYNEEATVKAIAGMFLAVNDVLKKDKDMRTGKGLCRKEIPREDVKGKVENVCMEEVNGNKIEKSVPQQPSKINLQQLDKSIEKNVSNPNVELTENVNIVNDKNVNENPNATINVEQKYNATSNEKQQYDSTSNDEQKYDTTKESSNAVCFCCSPQPRSLFSIPYITDWMFSSDPNECVCEHKKPMSDTSKSTEQKAKPSGSNHNSNPSSSTNNLNSSPLSSPSNPNSNPSSSANNPNPNSSSRTSNPNSNSLSRPSNPNSLSSTSNPKSIKTESHSNLMKESDDFAARQALESVKKFEASPSRWLWWIFWPFGKTVAAPADPKENSALALSEQSTKNDSNVYNNNNILGLPESAYILNPTIDGESKFYYINGNIVDLNGEESVPIKENESNDNNKLEPWYWYPVSGTVRLVSWIYSFWPSQTS